MYFFKSRLKDSVRALLSKNYIQSIPFQDLLQRIGPGNIRNFIQIGSNDGLKNDPLRINILSEKWQGILVEPNFLNFQSLVKNYAGQERLIFENVGIAEKNGSMTFHYIDGINEQDPGWLDQIGSFDAATFQKNISVDPKLEIRRKTMEIPVMRIEDLIKKYNLPYLDLLHIDAEGYDFKILNDLDLGRISPRIILFESEWLTSFELRELLNKLKSHQYEIYKDGFDHFAYKE